MHKHACMMQLHGIPYKHVSWCHIASTGYLVTQVCTDPYSVAGATAASSASLVAAATAAAAGIGVRGTGHSLIAALLDLSDT